MSSLTSPWSDVPDCLRRAEHKCDEALVAFMNGVIHACFFLGENGDALLEEFLNERYTRQGLKPNWFYVEPGRYSPGVLMAMKRRKAYDGWERLFFCKHHTTLIGGPFFKKSMARPMPKQMQLLEPQGEADRDIVQHSPAQFHQALNFIWYKANRGRFYLPIYSRGSTLVNHIPNEVELTHKDNLAKNLAEYTRSLLQLDHMPFEWSILNFPVHPETFSFRHWDQCTAFYELQRRHAGLQQRQQQLQHPTGGASSSTTITGGKPAVDLDNVWIIKPDGGSRGVGIGVFSDLRPFMEDHQRCQERLDGEAMPMREAKEDHKTGHYCFTRQIAQRYLARPLLLNGHKFDIRTYLMIVNVEDELVMYHDGYIRVNAEPYDTSCTDLDNLWKHLSNVSVQRTHPNFDQFSEDMRWDFGRFQQHLTEHHLAPPDWVTASLVPQMKRMMWLSFQSVKHKLRRTSPHAVFMMVGTDFIVDENLRIWLIEYSKSPAIFRTSSNHPLVKRWSLMIAEAATIVLEVDRRKLNGESFGIGSNAIITSAQTWKSCRP